ncbi:hypothetical protein [Chryseolinea sp. H1M3-3]|uniref:hypothetical protein n=1 Tax=Chryseolinea sp. H1M3-3 TaxID=3034144 RepID=UPI0023EA8ED2|nr:hypothetical protein [Chryseolinea sp. H1M3-3]
MIKNKLQTVSVFVLLVYVLIVESCAKNSENRNEIVFNNSVAMVQDSVKLMGHLLDQINDAEVKNFFFDNEEYLFINNKKIGRMAIGDKISFIDTVKNVTGLNEIESFKFVSLALFLKNNFISGCFKHRIFGIYLYNYKVTLENAYEDQRYIMVVEESTKKIKGSYVESYQIVDRKEDLLLIAPADIKIRRP